MNAKFRAKLRFFAPGALTLVVILASPGAPADDGNLQQQLRIERQKSGFELKLEQVRESARERAAGQRGSIEAPSPRNLGDGSESVRLDATGASAPAASDLEPASARRLREAQAYERDQRRYLDQRQRREGLIAGSRATGPAGARDPAVERRALTRSRSQNRRQAVQRRLRR